MISAVLSKCFCEVSVIISPVQLVYMLSCMSRETLLIAPKNYAEPDKTNKNC